MSQVIVLKHKEDPTKDIRLKESVLLINTKYPDGSPRLCTLIPDDYKISLAGGEEFVRAYIDEEMLSKSGTGEL